MSNFVQRIQRDLTALTRQVFEREEEFLKYFEITKGCNLDYFYMSGSLCLIGLESHGGAMKLQTTIKTIDFLDWIK